MELGHPLSVITPTIDGDVLTVLAHADKQFSTGDLQRMLGRSLRGLRLSLQRLTRQGIVTEQSTNTVVLYSLNRHHLAAAPIIELANLRTTLLTRITTTLEDWTHSPPFVALFGSAARGDMGPDSDIDLFVVRPDNVNAEEPQWQLQVSNLVYAITSWTGNDTRILEYSESRVKQAREPILAAIAAEGIPVRGSLRWLRSATGGSSHGAN